MFTHDELPHPLVESILRCVTVPPLAASTSNAAPLAKSHAYASVPTWSLQHESLQSCVRYIDTPGRQGSLYELGEGPPPPLLQVSG
jgi:hypothetical protein